MNRCVDCGLQQDTSVDRHLYSIFDDALVRTKEHLCGLCGRSENGNPDYIWDYGIKGYVRTKNVKAHPRVKGSATTGEIMNYSTNILDYYPFKKHPGNFKYPNKLPYLGVEMECTAKDQRRFYGAVRQIYTAMPEFCVVTNDASLPSNSFEIVTLPATLKYHQNIAPWKTFYETVVPSWLASEFTHSCGNHIHISKASMDIPQQYRFCAFLLNEDNRQEIIAIAGRAPTSYSHYQDLSSLFEDASGVRVNGREAIGTSRKQPTIEVRVFKASTKYENLMARLEFMDALRNWSINTRSNKGKIYPFKTFTAFLKKKKRSAEYPLLFNYMEENRIL